MVENQSPGSAALHSSRAMRPAIGHTWADYTTEPIGPLPGGNWVVDCPECGRRARARQRDGAMVYEHKGRLKSDGCLRADADHCRTITDVRPALDSPVQHRERRDHAATDWRSPLSPTSRPAASPAPGWTWLVIGLAVIGGWWLLSGSGREAAPTPVTRAGCDPAYPTLCLPLRGGDLDCKDIAARRFPVVGRDRHGFDRDHDGIGCE